MHSQYPLTAPAQLFPGMAADSNPLAGAFGSMIGYLGAEAGEPYVFERLLWPERFYNYNSLGTILKSAILMPLGGPFHKAALETLDRFRKKGLYRGAQKGHMLGTSFYPDSHLKFRLHGYYGRDHDVEVRNGLWALVLRKLQYHLTDDCPPLNQGVDSEGQAPKVRRTTQRVNHLQLSMAGTSSRDNCKVFCEDRISWATPITMMASEITAVLCGVAIVLTERNYYWFAAYMCFPLLLKLASLACSVRRDPAAPSVKSTFGDEFLVEVVDYDHGFPLISGPEEIVRQFFRHWGHPVRQTRYDRLREVSGITLVLGFVLYFPVGLLSMLWVSQTVQVIWLSYQMYLIVVMHFNRLVGFEGPGALDDNLAYELATKGIAGLHSKHGGTIVAKLTSTSVSRIREGQEEVAKIVARHEQNIVSLKRTDSDSSDSSTLADSADDVPILRKNRT